MVKKSTNTLKFDYKKFFDDYFDLYMSGLKNIAEETRNYLFTEISHVRGYPRDWIAKLKNSIDASFYNDGEICCVNVGLVYNNVNEDKQLKYIANLTEYGMGRLSDKTNEYLKSYMNSSDFNKERNSSMAVRTRSDMYYDVAKDAYVQGSAINVETRELGRFTDRKPFFWFENTIIKLGGDDGIYDELRDMKKITNSVIKKSFKNYFYWG